MRNPLNTKTLAAAATLAMLAGAAQAQIAGTYAGTTSEGLNIEITLTETESDGLVMTGNSTQWNEPCKTGDQKFAWWGVGAYLPVTSNKLTQTYKGQSLYETLTMKFDASGTTVTGTFTGGEATFVDVNSSTRSTEWCHSAKLSYTATLQSPLRATKHPNLPAGATLSLTPTAH